MIYIYKFTNLINGKVYVGSTKNIKQRLYSHKRDYKVKQYYSKFYCAIEKYGWESFMFDVIEECCPLFRNDRENYWINYYHTLDREYGYNLMLADCTARSEETLKKMSRSLKGKPSHNKGKKQSAEEILKRTLSVRAAYAAKRISPEERKRRRLESLKRYREKHKHEIKIKTEEQKNKEKKYKSEFYQKNKEQIKAKTKKYRDTHKDKFKIYEEEYRRTNRTELNNKAKKYYKENKEKILKRRKSKQNT